jgi:hypothetical protein
MTGSRTSACPNSDTGAEPGDDDQHRTTTTLVLPADPAEDHQETVRTIPPQAGLIGPAPSGMIWAFAGGPKWTSTTVLVLIRALPKPRDLRAATLARLAMSTGVRARTAATASVVTHFVTLNCSCIRGLKHRRVGVTIRHASACMEGSSPTPRRHGEGGGSALGVRCRRRRTRECGREAGALMVFAPISHRTRQRFGISPSPAYFDAQLGTGRPTPC